MKEKKDRVRIMLENIDETQAKYSACIIALESGYIDSNMQNRKPLMRHQSQSYKEVSPIYYDNRLFTSLLEKADESQSKMSIACIITHDSDYLWDDDEYEDDNSEGSENENTESERTENFEDIDQIAKQIIKENGFQKMLT